MKLKKIFLFLGLLLALTVFVFEINARESFIVTELSGNPQVLSPFRNTSQDLVISQVLQDENHLLTQSFDRANLRAGKDLNIRLKSDTEVTMLGPRLYDKKKVYAFNLKKGKLLVATGKYFQSSESIQIQIVNFQFHAKGGTFEVNVSEDQKSIVVYVLRGQVTVQDEQNPLRRETIRAHEKLEIKEGAAALEPKSLGQKEWIAVYPAYLMTPKERDFRKNQLELAQNSGSLFQFTYYVGDFYTHEMAYVESHFLAGEKDKSSIFDIYYDLKIPGSFAGVYLQTKGLELAQFDRFSFEAKHLPNMPYPEKFKIEFKAKGEIVQEYFVDGLTKQWRVHEFPIQVSSPVDIDEVVLVFSQAQVGDFPQGGVALRNFELRRKQTAMNEKVSA